MKFDRSPVQFDRSPEVGVPNTAVVSVQLVSVADVIVGDVIVGDVPLTGLPEPVAVVQTGSVDAPPPTNTCVVKPAAIDWKFPVPDVPEKIIL